jgi:hypothetical protein
MSRHRFKVGQLICLAFTRSSNFCRRRDVFQYRIKSATAPHERVVKEHDLASAE